MRDDLRSRLVQIGLAVLVLGSAPLFRWGVAAAQADVTIPARSER
jgi:hypothetical protein